MRVIIKVLHQLGMSDQALQTVYTAVVLTKLLYACSAWWATQRLMIAIASKLSAVVESGPVYKLLS